jgi:hypothetical protein
MNRISVEEDNIIERREKEKLVRFAILNTNNERESERKEEENNMNYREEEQSLLHGLQDVLLGRILCTRTSRDDGDQNEKKIACLVSDVVVQKHFPCIISLCFVVVV